MPLTVVLDTNIIVRAQISSTSWSARIFDAFLDGRFQLAVSESILQEVARTLRKPGVRFYTGLFDEEVDELTVLIRELAILTTDLYEVQAVKDDPDDNKFLACAIEAGASYVVSVDEAHLLSLKAFRLLDYRVEIIEPERLVEVLGI